MNRNKSKQVVITAMALAVILITVVGLIVKSHRDAQELSRASEYGHIETGAPANKIRVVPNAGNPDRAMTDEYGMPRVQKVGTSGATATDTGAGSSDNGQQTTTAAGDDTATSGTTELDPDATIVVSGFVMEAGGPAANAIVMAVSIVPQRQAQSPVGVTGKYVLPSLAPGDYVITAKTPNASVEKKITLMAEVQTVQLDFNLDDDDNLNKTPIAGIVVKKKDGKPIGDATVQLLEGGKQLAETTTSAEGTFDLLALRDGDYTISVHVGFYLPGQAPVAVKDGLADPESTRIELSGTGSLRVLVVTPEGQPVPNALVSLFGNATFNDPLEAYGSWQTLGDGTRELEITAPTSVSSFRIGAYKAGYVPGWSQELSASGAFGESVFRIPLAAGGMVIGRVVDKDAAPIEGASITVKEGFPRTGVVFQRVNEPFPSAVASADGTFQIGPIENGAASLGFGAEGYVSDVRTFVIGGPQLDVGDITLESSDENDQERIFGVVADQNGTPMVGHSVYMKSANGPEQFYARTDSRGGFKIDKVPEGEYVIYTNGSALRDGIYITVDQVYPFAKAGEGGLYLVYDMAQSLRFSVLSAGGDPVRDFRAGINVRYKGAAGSVGTREEFGLAYEQSFSAADGVANLDHLIAGTANLIIQADGFGAKRIDDISVNVGGETDLGTITLGSSSKVTGTVVGSENRIPLQGVTVRAVAPPGSGPEHPLNALSLKAISDGSGVFTLDNMPEGSAYLVLTKAGRAKGQMLLTVKGDEETYAGEIRLSLGARLRGTVTNSGSQLLSDVLIIVNDQTVFTDREGKFFYDTLSAGEVDVIADDRTGKYAKQKSTVNLQEGDEAVADFMLVPPSAPGVP